MTLGLLLAATSLGCLAGPLALNAAVAPLPGPLAWGVGGAFSAMLAGLLLALAARGAGLLLLSTFVRELGGGDQPGA